MRFWAQELALDRPVLSVGMQRAPLSRTERVVKRASDALAITALVLLSPLMSMTALAIRLV